ncbi:ATP-binding cassette domain-containing protein [Streptomyces sp. NPDC087219]|uniref:ATP-binding cassette domain-containing protein n=1 Tax=Streptomyces sp. NPDC087219 TaxID=3365770 RepID=UPI00382161F4
MTPAFGRLRDIRREGYDGLGDRTAAGVNQPSRGSVRLGRLSSDSRAYRMKVAWMPQIVTAMTGLTAREQVACTRWLKGMSRRAVWDASAGALAQVRMTDHADTRTKQLSGGQLRRVGVASALVHGAEVLLLDEPTAGTEPTQRRVFRDLVIELLAGEPGTGSVDGIPPDRNVGADAHPRCRCWRSRDTRAEAPGRRGATRPEPIKARFCEGLHRFRGRLERPESSHRGRLSRVLGSAAV